MFMFYIVNDLICFYFWCDFKGDLWDIDLEVGC